MGTLRQKEKLHSVNWEKIKMEKAFNFYQVAKIYDYVDDDGYNKLGNWIEKAAKDVGK